MVSVLLARLRSAISVCESFSIFCLVKLCFGRCGFSFRKRECFCVCVCIWGVSQEISVCLQGPAVIKREPCRMLKSDFKALEKPGLPAGESCPARCLCTQLIPKFIPARLSDLPSYACSQKQINSLETVTCLAAMLAEDVAPSLARFRKSCEPGQVVAAWKDLTVNQASRLQSLAIPGLVECRVWAGGTMANPNDSPLLALHRRVSSRLET